MEARPHDHLRVTRVVARPADSVARVSGARMAFRFLRAEASGSIFVRFLRANHASWLVRKTRVRKVHADQPVERDLHQQIHVELSEDSQRVARAFWSDLPTP